VLHLKSCKKRNKQKLQKYQLNRIMIHKSLIGERFHNSKLLLKTSNHETPCEGMMDYKSTPEKSNQNQAITE
jgi:hypothetical protein